MVEDGVRRHCDIVSATQRQLTWTHLKSLMYIKDPLERQFPMDSKDFANYMRRNLEMAKQMERTSK